MLNIFLNVIKNEDNKSDRTGSIRKEEEIKDCILEINQDLENKKYKIDNYKTYLNGSLIIQNIIYNTIKENLLSINEDKIALYSFENSYIDIAVDISQFMSENHKILALIICTALAKSFTDFRANIRISVFAEKDNIWYLSKGGNFTNNEDIFYQILRLRDSLKLYKKRYFSVPADALVKLKQSFKSKGNNKSKYVQILISSLISAQIIDEEIDWDNLKQTIIIFGLKSDLSENFREKIMKEYNKTVEESILNIRYHSKNSNRSQNVHQRFFTLSYFLPENDDQNEEKNYIFLIKEIIKTIKSNNNLNEDLLKRLPKNEKFNLNYLYNFKNSEIEEIEKIIDGINSNIKVQKNLKNDTNYFAQNAFTEFNQNNINEEIYQELSSFEVPSIEIKHDLKYYNDELKLQKLDKNLTESLNLTFSDCFEKNISTRIIYGPSGVKISIKAFISNYIFSDGANLDIFERKGGNDKRRYFISFVIDLSQSSFLIFNYQHMVSTLILLLISPSLIEGNNEIFIDIIVNSSEGVKIIDYNIESKDLKNIYKLAEIVSIIKKNINYSCCPGTCLFMAYKVLSLKRGDKKIFLITDSFISSIKEIYLTIDLIDKFNNEKIEFCTIGVGSFPYGINKIYPKCCYTNSYINLNNCLSICLGKDKSGENMEIKSNLYNYPKMEKEAYKSFFNENPFDEKLIDSIKSKEVDLRYILFNELEQKFVEIKIENPQIDVYRDGIFNSFSYQILVVILYLGGNDDNKDKSISEENFKSNAGNMIHKKGLNYTLVYNYIDAINELSKKENEKCKYVQTWIFCSDGSGNTPNGNHKIYRSKTDTYEDGVNKIITKEDNENYLIPFLKTISDFNQKGGALLLFCDNEPFVLETNLLLTKYLQFQGKDIKEGSANFKMGGNYFNESKEKENFMIRELSENAGDKNGKFEATEYLKIGNEEKNIIPRYSLRIGIKEFHEGITLSYAKTLNNTKNYAPFQPFAYLTDKNQEKPFILYYEPLIGGEESRGPIVVHGGFTSAFYEFKNDGTGKLLSSIACWLLRPEITLLDTILIPPVPEFKVNEIFKEWINNLVSVYSILILDVSGSMEDSNLYEPLIELANDIIKNQKDSEENEGAIIFFASSAKVVKEGKYKDLYNEAKSEDPNNEGKVLKIKDIYDSKVGGGTNFLNGFELAEEKIKNLKKEFIMKRILFLTDGEDNDFEGNKNEINKICEFMKSKNFLLQYICFNSEDGYNQLKELIHDYITNKNIFDEVKNDIMKQFAALS